ncbi:MAG: hypothetical protein ABIQ95_03895 [Bdellovibrionia bacterium]
MTLKFILPRLFIFFLLLSSAGLFANSAFAEKSRQKVIDFDGDVVEGVNKRPLDSLTQVSEKEKRRKKIHLYHKRRGFRTETQEILREMRYAE